MIAPSAQSATRADPHAKRFGYHGLTISVRCDDAAHIAWLEEFLSPAFSVDDDSAPACHVAMNVEAKRYADLLRRGPSPDCRSIACFANDTGLVSLPEWTSPDAARTLFDRRSNVFYVVRPEHATIEIVSGRSSLVARPALMRVVRELAMMHVAHAGGLMIHGGAIGTGGLGLVIAGPKRSGKTTLLMHVLRAAGIGFVSNDRVAVFANGSTPTLRGMPTIVTIRQQTARRFPELAPWLSDSSSHYRRRLSEMVANGSGGGRDGQQRVSLSATQFCHAMQVNPIAEATLTALLFPRVTGRPGPLVMTRLNREDAAERLRGGLFRAGSSVTLADGLAVLASPDAAPPMRESLSNKIVDGVPAFACELGRSAYARPDALADLVRDVLMR